MHKYAKFREKNLLILTVFALVVSDHFIVKFDEIQNCLQTSLSFVNIIKKIPHTRNTNKNLHKIYERTKTFIDKINKFKKWI